MDLLQKIPNKLALFPSAWFYFSRKRKTPKQATQFPPPIKDAYPKQQLLQTHSDALVTQQKEQRSDLSILKLKLLLPNTRGSAESLDSRKCRTSEASVFFHPDVRLLAAHAELLHKNVQLGHCL